MHPGVEAEAVEVIEHLDLVELQVFGNPLDETVLLDEVLEECFETVLEIAVVEIVVVVGDVTTLESFEFDQFVPVAAVVVVEDAYEPFEVVAVVAAAVAFEHEVVLDAASLIAVVVVPVVAASFAAVAED